MRYCVFVKETLSMFIFLYFSICCPIILFSAEVNITRILWNIISLDKREKNKKDEHSKSFLLQTHNGM